MAYILKPMSEEFLKERLTEKAYDVTMEYFKNNPMKSVCDLGGGVKIRKFTDDKTDVSKYTIDYRR